MSEARQVNIMGKRQVYKSACLLLLAIVALSPGGRAQEKPPLKLVSTIRMSQIQGHQADLSAASLAQAVSTERIPGISGHFDRFGLDLKGDRLFVTPEDNGTVEVYNLATGKFEHSIGGIGMAHGVLYRADLNRLYVTDGTDGLLRIFDGKSYQLLKTVKLLTDADSIGYDAKTHDLYIASGGKDAKLDYCLLSIVNTDTGEHVGDIKIDGARLEQMVLEQSGPRLFINITDKREVGVIDRNRRAVVATWPVTEGEINAAIALDEAEHRLFVGCRSGQLVVFNTDTGRPVAVLPISQGADDMTYDPVRRRIYVPCGQGFVDVFDESDPDHYRRIGKIATGPMGKTGLLVSSLNRYFVAVPQHGKTDAEILVFAVQ